MRQFCGARRVWYGSWAFVSVSKVAPKVLCLREDFVRASVEILLLVICCTVKHDTSRDLKA
jgi:hypothetical protein